MLSHADSQVITRDIMVVFPPTEQSKYKQGANILTHENAFSVSHSWRCVNYCVRHCIYLFMCTYLPKNKMLDFFSLIYKQIHLFVLY